VSGWETAQFPMVAGEMHLLNGDRRAIEFGERQTVWFVVSELLLFQDADRDRLAQFQRFGVVAAPVDPGGVSSNGNVGGKLVQLTTYC
jgi:hypothetical protein